MSAPPRSRPEVLAPAGDEAALRAAILAGADAVYFGLQGFNARARATNFDAAALAATMRELRHVILILSVIDTFRSFFTV